MNGAARFVDMAIAEGNMPAPQAGATDSDLTRVNVIPISNKFLVKRRAVMGGES